MDIDKKIFLSQEEFGTLFSQGEKNFSNCILQNVEIADKDLTGCSFQNSNMQVEVFNSVMKNCDFTRAFIHNSAFENCDFTEANFSHTDIADTFFKNIFADGVKNVESLNILLPDSTEENVEIYKKSILKIFQTKATEKNTDEVQEASKPLSKETQRQDKLSGEIVKKINLMKKDGTPMRVCPNGQVYIDPEHLKYFKRSEIYDLQKYYENKYGKTFQTDPSITVLPEKLREKIRLMEEGSVQLTKLPDGRVQLPLLQLRYFTNEDISVLNSYYMNQMKELQPKKTDYPFSEKINQKLEILNSKAMPMRVCPNGQVVIPTEELRYFKGVELREINQYYNKKANETFRRDPSVKSISDLLKEKLQAMERETGKKLVVTKLGKAVLPISELNHFTDSEISTLNSYYMNMLEKTQTTVAYAAPEP